ncbi:hypothetical protein OG21DRAFT_1527625 [Imleria badia]|nr:hypothetical protein OG21DRAFT_1527625 [Imleria badia]
MGSCPHVDAYIQSSRATHGSDNHIHLPDGRRIPRVPGTNCLKDYLDRLVASAATPVVSSAVTTGLFSLTYPDTDTVLDIDPLVFWSSIHRADDCDDYDSALEHLDFQSYITQALANFKADKDKGKQPRFNGVHMPPRIPRPASVTEEIVSPAIEAVQTTLTASSSSTALAPAASRPPPPPTTTKSNVPICFEPTNNALPAPTGQFRYSCPIEDETAPHQILDRTSSDPRLGVGDYRPYPGQGPSVGSPGVSIALCCIEAKVVGTGRTINAVLDSGSEIIAMPKRVWEGLGLPVRSDHVMTMSNANTSTDSTIGVVENLALDFGAREVYLQVQVQ